MEQNATNISTELIRVVQLPIIADQLISMKTKWEQIASEAMNTACTEDTIQVVKSKRSEIRKEFDELEDRRKAVKKAVLAPYEQFERIYEDCISNAFLNADAALKGKIANVESEMKRRCENDLRIFFAELCEVNHLDWLTYEQAGIKVDMASAKAKTPKKLQDQLRTFVTSVSDSVNRISLLDDAEEIMVEYRESLNAADAICTVQERHRRIEQERTAGETRRTRLEQENEAVRKVEAPAPPVEVKQEKILSMDFRATGTMEQLKTLKQFAQANGIKLEGIKHE